VQELVDEVTKRTGIPEKQAEQAVEVVMSFMKERLPDPIGNQLESLLQDENAAQQAGDLLKGLGGMFGKK
jgi:uncharacterized protein (DUF2267 family)